METADKTDKLEQIQRFLSICDELVTGSYMNAEGKISEALKNIHQSFCGGDGRV